MGKPPERSLSCCPAPRQNHLHKRDGDRRGQTRSYWRRRLVTPTERSLLHVRKHRFHTKSPHVILVCLKHDHTCSFLVQ